MISILILFLLFQFDSVTIFELPEGNLMWSTERPNNAKFCVPAAFTSEEGTVEGEYKLDGRIYNPNKRLKISLDGNTFYVDKVWRSDVGFQQLILVHKGKAKSFKDSRRYVRRALCKKNERVFLVESNSKMTLTEFAKECNKVSSEAVYLDMGSYGFGYLGNRLLSPFAFFGRMKQSNWLYIE